MWATEQYFPLVRVLSTTCAVKVIVTFESVDEILMCYHSNKSYRAVHSCCIVYYAAQGGCNFWVCEWNPDVLPQATEQYLLVVMFSMLSKGF